MTIGGLDPVMNAAGIELAAARHWQAPEEEHLGEWLLRASAGFTGRANSALALGDPGVELADAIDAVAAWYQARNLPPMVAVPLISPAHDRLDALLAERRWPMRSGAASVMTAELAAIPAPPAGLMAEAGDAAAGDAATRPSPRLHLADAPDADWLAHYHYRGSELPPIARTLLLSAPAQCFLSIRDGEGDDDGSTVAIARVSVDGDWAGVTAVEVDSARRRQGLGTAITLAACAQARHLGASRMFLQVEKENTAARALYARIGFRDSHEYHYRVAPA